MAALSELRKSRAPAKKKLPTDPLLQSNRCAECTRICVLKCTRNARIVCWYRGSMPCHSGSVPSTMRLHAMRASSRSLGSRYCKRPFTATASGVDTSESRRQRDRMSPTAGPPSTRTISAVEPPSSETGITCAMRVDTLDTAAARLFMAVPPENRTSCGWLTRCGSTSTGRDWYIFRRPFRWDALVCSD